VNKSNNKNSQSFSVIGDEFTVDSSHLHRAIVWLVECLVLELLAFCCRLYCFSHFRFCYWYLHYWVGGESQHVLINTCGIHVYVWPAVQPEEPKRYAYDTIRDAILTCAQKLTQVSLIYRKEPKTKKWKKKNQKVKMDMPRSIHLYNVHLGS